MESQPPVKSLPLEPATDGSKPPGDLSLLLCQLWLLWLLGVHGARSVSPVSVGVGGARSVPLVSVGVGGASGGGSLGGVGPYIGWEVNLVSAGVGGGSLGCVGPYIGLGVNTGSSAGTLTAFAQ